MGLRQSRGSSPSGRPRESRLADTGEFAAGGARARTETDLVPCAVLGMAAFMVNRCLKNTGSASLCLIF
jgi:hypothetical protein